MTDPSYLSQMLDALRDPVKYGPAPKPAVPGKCECSCSLCRVNGPHCRHVLLCGMPAPEAPR